MIRPACNDNNEAYDAITTGHVLCRLGVGTSLVAPPTESAKELHTQNGRWFLITTICKAALFHIYKFLNGSDVPSMEPIGSPEMTTDAMASRPGHPHHLMSPPP